MLNCTTERNAKFSPKVRLLEVTVMVLGQVVKTSVLTVGANANFQSILVDSLEFLKNNCNTT